MSQKGPALLAALIVGVLLYAAPGFAEDDEDVVVVDGLQITVNDVAKAQAAANQTGLQKDLHTAAKLQVGDAPDGTPADTEASHLAAQNASENAIEAGHVNAVIATHLDETNSVSIGEKKKNRIILGAVTAVAGESSGSLPAEVIAQVIRANIGGVRTTYERYLKVNPDLGGRILVEVTVTEDGSVGFVKVVDDTVGYPEMTSELTKKIIQWRFPPPNGGSFKFSYPFSFVQSL